METNSGSTTPRERDFTQSEPHRAAVCLPAAPLGDVLFDQLEYLIAHHGGQPCPPGCPECLRLERAEEWLLRPFRGSLNWEALFPLGMR